MANLMSVLKKEITRLARKEVRDETEVTRRAAAAHRRDIASLKRLIADLNRRVSFLERQERRRVAGPVAPAEAESRGHRFSPRWLKIHRERLGLSAENYGKLVGVSGLTIYNWETGKARPRDSKLPALAAVRTLRKREALKRLEMIK